MKRTKFIESKKEVGGYQGLSEGGNGELLINRNNISVKQDE